MNPLLLSFIASLSTMLGSVLVLYKRNYNILIQSFSLTSGVMIAISIFDLLPEAFLILSKLFVIFPAICVIAISFCIGVLISFIIEKIMSNNNDIYKVGVVNMIAIITHNIPEGILTYIVGTINIKLGIMIAISIMLHNIPEGLAISLPIYYATNNKYKSFIYTFIAGISEFIGAIFASIFFKNLISDLFIGIILSIIAGIMIQITLYELLPSVIKYKSKNSIIYFFIGILIMILSVAIMR